jgi:hypothetical protein
VLQPPSIITAASTAAVAAEFSNVLKNAGRSKAIMDQNTFDRSYKVVGRWRVAHMPTASTPTSLINPTGWSNTNFRSGSITAAAPERLLAYLGLNRRALDTERGIV